MKGWFLSLFLLCLPVFAVQSAQMSERSKLTAGEIAQLPYQDPATGWQLVKQGAQLVDVRTPPEYEAEKIPQALNIPVQVIEVQSHQLNKNIPVVVYCRSGNRSQIATRILQSQGFVVYDAGGYRKLIAAKPRSMQHSG